MQRQDWDGVTVRIRDRSLTFAATIATAGAATLAWSTAQGLWLYALAGFLWLTAASVLVTAQAPDPYRFVDAPGRTRFYRPNMRLLATVLIAAPIFFLD